MLLLCTWLALSLSLLSTCSWCVVSALAPLCSGCRCIIRVDCKTTIHNKALYKCIIHSFIHSFIHSLCAWLCFDSSPHAHCQRDCFPTLLVSLFVSSSYFTPGSHFLFSLSLGLASCPCRLHFHCCGLFQPLLSTHLCDSRFHIHTNCPRKCSSPVQIIFCQIKSLLYPHLNPAHFLT